MHNNYVLPVCYHRYGTFLVFQNFHWFITNTWWYLYDNKFCTLGPLIILWCFSRSTSRDQEPVNQLSQAWWPPGWAYLLTIERVWGLERGESGSNEQTRNEKRLNDSWWQSTTDLGSARGSWAQLRYSSWILTMLVGLETFSWCICICWRWQPIWYIINIHLQVICLHYRGKTRIART